MSDFINCWDAGWDVFAWISLTITLFLVVIISILVWVLRNHFKKTGGGVADAAE